MTQTKAGTAEDPSGREIVISRVFAAPRELVWEVWTDPKHMVEWWGPEGFTMTIQQMDLRPGGAWRHILHGPDGTDYPGTGVFLEIVKPERIVYSLSGGRKGEVQFESTWTFEEQGEKTKVTLRMFFPSAEMRDYAVKTYRAIEGGNQTLERLARHLEESAAGRR
jgi:uncharacterized protein YndB with AHSA1/START domain